ncbi:hypothetical protein M408DRAFT_328860 [Serendipita vermifera MAFF 305830]|uniref:DNA polymerase epsilon subunit n=1 Tax=Serendipita vermifera MAFF 305830 TaxID=933852 RepID=A0A0C2XJC4_SERVB|nr:hypothetical protein M408DRAFT_328860 [Serendipita vermifera MAFF 305830]
MDFRQVILKVFTRKHQLSLQADAMALLQQILVDHDIGTVEDATVSLEMLAKDYLLQDDCSTIVTKPILQRVYDELVEKSSSTVPGGSQGNEAWDPDHHLHFINAFDMPRWHYSQERKVFEKAGGRPAIAGVSESKAVFLRDRHNIIKQIVLRNENFSPPAFAGSDRANYLRLTSTRNLLGRSGGRFLLFGMLTRSPEGRLCLEDLDGTVPLDISQTGPSEGLFTEGCFVLVEGDYNDEDTLAVIAIGHPPSERRAVARSIYGHIDFLGKGATTVLEDEKWTKQVQRPENADLAILFISDVRLDENRTLKGLRRLFEQAVEAEVIPKVFVLCGSFTSGNVSNDVEMDIYKDGFTALGDLITEFPLIRSNSHFLFVPGPNDPWSSDVLPRRPLPSVFTSRLLSKLPKTAVFGTNPCRIKFMGQEIVVYRQDLMGKMMRNLVGVKPDLESADLKRYLVQTVIDQAHLSPVSLTVQATLWEFDHSLRLYPMPTAVVLADSYEPYELTYEGCHVFNPGSFLTSNYGFSTFYMATSRSMPGGLEGFVG